MITFQSIHPHSTLIEENEFYRLYHNTDAPYMYDYNCMYLKYQPTLEEFKLIEKIQLEFHEDMGLEHVKFYWPQDTGFSQPVLDYFIEQVYGVQLLELYAVHPRDFMGRNPHPDVQIEFVSEDSLSDFKQISYLQDLDIGESFADQKQSLYDLKFADPFIRQIIAYLDNEPVGGVDIIENKGTVEIDNLFVNEDRQHQGIATALQLFVMKQAGDRTVILVADGEDTPKDMYTKQNYIYLGFQAGAQKEL